MQAIKPSHKDCLPIIKPGTWNLEPATCILQPKPNEANTSPRFSIMITLPFGLEIKIIFTGLNESSISIIILLLLHLS